MAREGAAAGERAAGVVVGEVRCEHHREALAMIIARPALRAAFLGATGAITPPLAEAIAARLPAGQDLTGEVLAASVCAAVRIALDRWLQAALGLESAGFVVTSGSLPELLRRALAPLGPAFDAAENS